VPAAAAVVALAACGSSGSSSTGAAPPSAAGGGGGGLYGSGVSSTPAGTAPASTAGLTLRHTSLGTILTNGQGFTLYAFQADKGTTSSCTGACAQAWPPVTTTSSNIAVSGGAAKSLVGETTRAGGARQLTYAGHPLYLFTGDSNPGATNGQESQAFGAPWVALTAKGTEVTSG
jgi:predicted lipoprotein with Yx(FWY)xxD motif